jgi:rhodanese-related sulfurtransferase
MILFVAIVFVALIVVAGIVVRSRQLRREAEALLQLMRENHDLLLFDVRLPLDLLAHPEVIPGTVRLPPKEVQAQAASIPKEKDIVIYGTCLDKKTLHLVVQITQKLRFCKLKMLRGGFEGWKQMGLPVEAYTTPFHLDTPTGQE